MVTGAVTTPSAHTLLIRGSSLVHLFGSGSLAHRLVYLLGSWPLVLHSSVCLSIAALSARVVVAGPSARVVVAGPSARVVVVGPSARVVVAALSARVVVVGPSARVVVVGPSARVVVAGQGR